MLQAYPLLKKLERPIDGERQRRREEGDYFQLKDIRSMTGSVATRRWTSSSVCSTASSSRTTSSGDSSTMSIWRLSGLSRILSRHGLWRSYQYSGVELVSKMGWRRGISTGYPAILKETLEELKIGAAEIEEVMQVIETRAKPS